MNANCTNWLFGRGLSIACDLKWAVPSDWNQFPRNEQIDKIKNALRQEMALSSVNTKVISQLLFLLGERTTKLGSHRFITTNWDCLLQNEIISQGWTVKPDWLASSHVLHLNGNVDDSCAQEIRSPFLLETDPSSVRNHTLEADEAFSHMMWGTHFVVVGMSFECAMDKFLLHSLNQVQDDLPIGNSKWLIINPDVSSCVKVVENIRSALPRASIFFAPSGFTEWLSAGAKELFDWGVLS